MLFIKSFRIKDKRENIDVRGRATKSFTQRTQRGDHKAHREDKAQKGERKYARSCVSG